MKSIRKHTATPERWQSYLKNRRMYMALFRKDRSQHLRVLETATKRRYRRKMLEAIAGRPKPEICDACGNVGDLSFDHNHRSGVFRGWICARCNKALGFVEDSIETLRMLIDYLENANSLDQ